MHAFAFLSVFFVIAIASATFIEHFYTREIARVLVYDALYFEMLCFYYAALLIYHIFSKSFFKRKKYAALGFHFAIVFILLGAFVTRHFGEEGVLHLRENQAATSFFSSDNYVQIDINDGSKLQYLSKKASLTPFNKKSYKQNAEIDGETMQFRSIDYISNAEALYYSVENGIPIVFLNLIIQNQEYEIPLAEGEYLKNNAISLSTDISRPADINFRFVDDEIFFFSHHDVQMQKMKSDSGISLFPLDSVPLLNEYRYQTKNIEFAVAHYMPSAEIKYQSSTEEYYRDYDVAHFQINYKGESSRFYLPILNNTKGSTYNIEIEGIKLSVSYGAKEIKLPFTVKLKRFLLESYPGSESPSAFISEMQIIDEEKNKHFDTQVSMNNVLDYRGYRFFQSSYDKDEKGTILSVNHDPWGKYISYFAYFLLFLSIILSLLSPHSLFRKNIKKLSANKSLLFLGFFLIPAFTFAQTIGSAGNPVDKKTAQEFGTILIQDTKGRIKPINTFSQELIRKITGELSILNNNADQFHLGMIIQSEEWQKEKIFPVNHPELRSYLDLKEERISLRDLYLMGNPELYKLKPLLENAYGKVPAERNQFDKEVIKLDEKINVFLMLQSGIYLRIFPHPLYDSIPWLTPIEYPKDMKEIDSLFVNQAFSIAMQALVNANNERAVFMFQGIREFQYLHAPSDIIPSPTRVKLELVYNKIRPFSILAIAYAFLAFILLSASIFLYFKKLKLLHYVVQFAKILLVFAVVFHFLAFISRWYIAGYAPLSNAYESMVFAAFAIVASSLFFIKRKAIVPAIAATMGALCLLVARMSWMNPEITNLVPVLQSPWLTIHVAVVMIGYALAAISFLIAFINIVLLCFLMEDNKKKILALFQELILINKIILIPALYFIAAGCFLGAIWANEAWGRYWSWDPKEAWTLIIIMVYGIIVHAPRIKFLQKAFVFNTTVFFAFSTILMTYFGVNYFLGGMHSYAGGQMPAISKDFLFPLSFLLILIIFAFYKYKTFTKNERK